MFTKNVTHRIRPIISLAMVALVATFGWVAYNPSTRTELSASGAIPVLVASPVRVTASDLFRAEHQEAQERVEISSSINRLTARDLFRAERRETCERRLILGEKRLTGSALIRAAHQDAHAQALAWGMEALAKTAQAVDLVSDCQE